MQRKKMSPEFTVSYHKHPEVGGMGHISINGEHGDEKVELNIYPQEKPSLLQPLSLLTFYLFPTKANHLPLNYANYQKDDIVASYKIHSDNIPNPEEAYAKLKKTRESLDSGHTGFSIMPNSSTHAIYALVSSKTSCHKMHIGFKTLERNVTHNELNKVTITNCAHATEQVLSAGGVSKPADIFSYHTPSGINTFFQSNRSFVKIENDKNALNSAVKHPLKKNS